MSTPERPVVDGAFNQKPILTRAVVTVASLVAVAAVGALAYALFKPAPDQTDQARTPDAPSGVQAVQSGPDIVTLTWEPQQDVDSYVLLQTEPNTDNQPFDPPGTELRLQVKTSGHYCYQLEAVRKDADNSAPSDPPACVDTVLPATIPESTESPSIEVMPTEGATTEPTSPGTSVTPPVDEPQQYVAALKFINSSGFPDPQAEAESARQEFLAQNVPAEVLDSDAWLLDPEMPQPTWIVYLDGATPDEAQAACAAVQASQPELVLGNCQVFQVAPLP